MLLQAGAGVEICYVEEEGVGDSRAPKSKGKGATGRRKKIKPALSDQEDAGKRASTKCTDAIQTPAVCISPGVDVILIQDSDNEEPPRSDTIPSRKRHVSESVATHPTPTHSTAAPKKARLSSAG